MKSENVLWKQITGIVFIGLALALYAPIILIVVLGRQHGVKPEFVSSIADSLVMILLADWPAVLFLTIGIAWTWNSKKAVGVWCYWIATVYFLGLGSLLLASWFITGFANTKSIDHWVLGVMGLALLLIGILYGLRAKKLSNSMRAAEPPSLPHVIAAEPKRTISPVTSRRRPASFAICNILDATADARRVWQFDANKFSLKAEQTKYPGEALPAKMVGKDWSSLFQHKMNIALLPSSDVFLRVIQLPMASLEETISMVELQLEKISPAPVAQVVWTLHVLPNAQEGMQTVLVVIAPRNAVEEFLGKLEGQGYIADRLEVSFLEQLLTTNITENGAWVYPDGRGKNSAVIAWWYGGILRSVNFIVLPADGLNTANLHNQLRQMTWAGELDGWLTAPPAWHLVADESTRMAWEPILRESVDARLDVIAPLSAQEVAGLTARRAVANPTQIALLPPEYVARYRQQFRDRLWLRGLLAVGGLYCAGVLIYFAALYVLNIRADRVENELAGISGSYTNAIELKARLAILQDRAELKFAALDCWKAVSDLLPDSMTLDAMNFNDGQKLTLSGSFSGDANEVLDFSESLRKVTNNAQSFFNQQAGDPFAITRGSSWTYNLELKRSEVTP